MIEGWQRRGPYLFSHFGPRDVIPWWSWIVILLNKIIP